MRIDKWLKDLGICESTSEARRLIKQGGIAFNKEKIPTDTTHIYIVGSKYYLSSVDVYETEEYKKWKRENGHV